jgi:hypothetical protein
MLRLTIALALLHASQTVLAAPGAADAATGAATAGVPAMKFVTPADPDRVLPPLPPLASLPASAAQDVEDTKDEAPVTHGTHRGKKTLRSRAHVVKPAEIVVRMVVSPESRAYLMSMSSKLDAVLRGTASDARSAPDGVSVAMTR